MTATIESTETAETTSTELAIVDPVIEPAEIIDAEIVEEEDDDTPLAPGVALELPEGTLPQAKAEALDKKLRAANDKLASGFDTLLNLMEQAASGHIHLSLGYETIVDYLNEAVTFAPTDSGERRLMAAAMAGKGFSQRLTAKVLGVSQSTVRDDLKDAKVSGDYSPTATKDGIDGKTYTNTEKSVEEVREEAATKDADTAPAPLGQAKALKAALNAVTKAAGLLEGAFENTDNFDADVNPELVAEVFKELRKTCTRINAVGKKLSTLS